LTLLNNSGYGLRLDNGYAVLASSTVASNGAAGVYASAGKLSFFDNIFANNGNEAVSITNPSVLGNHSGNIASGNDINGIYITGTVSSNQTWQVDSIPYVPYRVTVGSGHVLEVSPGVVAKLYNTTSRFIVNGTLNAIGSSGSPIYFTSFKDDSVGGDTNNDATSTTPAAGDWHQIQVASGGVANMEHVVVRYGGAYASPYTYSNIYNLGELNIASSTISNASYGIWQGSGTTTVEYTEIKNNSTGLYISSGATGAVSLNSFHDNASYGLRNTTATTINAENNFWGDATGPTHASNPSGIGDEVSNNIDFDPWLTSW